MVRYFKVRVAVWLVTATIAILLAIAYFVRGPSEYEKLVKTTALLSAVRNAVATFYQDYNRWPTGTASEIAHVLSGENVRGENPRQKKFITFIGKRPVNQRGELIDAWGTPLMMFVDASDSYAIYSCGPNRIDNRGKNDDIYFFVSKP
jgi:hypothetical protein